jgi:hypothetical protein
MLAYRHAVSHEVVVGDAGAVQHVNYAAVITRKEETLDDTVTGGWQIVEVPSVLCPCCPATLIHVADAAARDVDTSTVLLAPLMRHALPGASSRTSSPSHGPRLEGATCAPMGQSTSRRTAVDNDGESRTSSRLRLLPFPARARSTDHATHRSPAARVSSASNSSRFGRLSRRSSADRARSRENDCPPTARPHSTACSHQTPSPAIHAPSTALVKQAPQSRNGDDGDDNCPPQLSAPVRAIASSVTLSPSLGGYAETAQLA